MFLFYNFKSKYDREDMLLLYVLKVKFGTMLVFLYVDDVDC